MPEDQNVEYKSSRHDDWLKWVCGFANGQGGRIYVGKDDKGRVVGLDDYVELMDGIPNKIKSALGITAEVNLLEEEGEKYIEIVVQPYSTPISLRGRYYHRSGSVKEELTGAALNEFMLRRSGNTWDDVVEPDATLDDIDEGTVRAFIRNAEKAGRIPDTSGLSTGELLDKLHLTKNGGLKRAAIILFGKDPGYFYPSTFVKIGKFDDDHFTIRFQETEYGNIISILDAVLRQLNHHFLIRHISFQGMNRIETLEYPLEALREMILNSLIHRNYMGAPTQLRVYDDKLTLWNEGRLPEAIPLSQLKESHSSHPRNPTLATACFLGSLIDAWGSGIMKIIDSCLAAGLPEPSFEEREGGFIVTLYKNKHTEEQLAKLGLNQRQIKAVLHVKEKGRITNKDYQEINACSRNTASSDLKDLEHRLIFKNSDVKGAGSYYQLVTSK
ncbi:MAG: putative DNA binding domain-containing protein [Methanomassiliicoccaceae archaeon]|nr:putative DNA binding domain-containing protein [Methanomassiliicoccaceae archaeon]